MRIAGATWRAIADALGYSSAGSAHKDVERARQQQLGELAENAEHLRWLELEHLDALRRKMWDVLGRGDDEPAMRAVDRLLKISERRARLLGLDSPVLVESGVTVRYAVEGVDMEALR